MVKKIDIVARVELLNKASDAYYNKNSPIMSDYEFDCKFDELDIISCKFNEY